MKGCTSTREEMLPSPYRGPWPVPHSRPQPPACGGCGSPNAMPEATPGKAQGLVHVCSSCSGDSPLKAPRPAPARSARRTHRRPEPGHGLCGQNDPASPCTAVCAWAHAWASLGLCFLTQEVGILIVPTTPGCSETPSDLVKSSYISTQVALSPRPHSAIRDWEEASAPSVQPPHPAQDPPLPPEVPSEMETAIATPPHLRRAA